MGIVGFGGWSGRRASSRLVHPYTATQQKTENTIQSHPAQTPEHIVMSLAPKTSTITQIWLIGELGGYKLEAPCCLGTVSYKV